ncbi:hypothetical protein [uncultured Megasphaera sp.]|uniref:hypothetical protein n=1 Tax=uncultured Megasphaera sp. TaxID=165188 RepID=UPI0025961EE0|nr:hypothetical protein [uncultured Megasphaera sp.]
MFISLRLLWRTYAHWFWYTLGTIGSALLICFLLWLAYCIAIKAKPLAAIQHIPLVGSFPIFLLLLVGILCISIFAWQQGAIAHEKYHFFINEKNRRTNETK